MAYLLILLCSLTASSTELTSTLVPAQLYRQFERIENQPLSGNPVAILSQFLPPGSYRIKIVDGRDQWAEIRQNSLSYRIGSLLEIKHHYANLQPGGGVMFTSGRTVVVRDGSEWKVKFSFLHRAKPRCGARLDGETPRLVKLQLTIDQFHEIREILWDTAMFDGGRSRGRAKIYRRRPPESPRGRRLSPLPFPKR